MKMNEATHNRPDGNRVLDAPCVITDIKSAIWQLQQEEAWEKSDRNAITLFKTEGLTTVLICLQENSGIANTIINGLVTIQVVEGNVKLTLENDTTSLQAGQLIMIHSNIWHNLLATEPSVLLLSNYVRESDEENLQQQKFGTVL